MENDVKQSMDLLQLLAWAHARRKQLISITVAIVAVAAIAGIYVWHKNAVEDQANAALSAIKVPNPQAPSAAADGDAYAKVAADFSGTAAAARALLIGGGIYFDSGKFDQARAQFEKFLSQYPDNQLANQASYGVAACLEAQGKLAEATSRYEDLAKRHAADATGPEVKSALGRLYLAQNKPEQALRYYEELAHANNNDTWSAEAGIQAAELVAKYPNLKKPVAPPAPALTAPPAAAPAATAPPALTVPPVTNAKPAKP